MQKHVDFTGFKVLIKENEEGAVIAEAKVLEYERNRLTITVSSKGLIEHYNKRLSILLLNDKFVYEYGGIARKKIGSELTEISLYRGREKQVRANTRYDVKIHSVIDNIEPKNPYAYYSDPLEVVVVNLSKDGILIETHPTLLDEKTTYRVKLDIDGSTTYINTEVVRVIEKNDTEWQYGGRFLSIESPQGNEGA